LLCDEFSNYLDSEIAKKVLLVLKKLNIEFSVLPVMDSARSLISKGFLEEAKITINQNLEELKHLVQEDAIIIGIEPSSILGFKDDYKRLVNANNKEFLENISKSKIVIVNRSSLNKHPDYLNMINNIYLLVKKIYKRSVRRFNLYNFIYILISSLVLNDIILFKNFVLRKMSGVRFKKHKRLLSMFRYAFRLATSYFLHRGFIKGFFFTMSGKIGIGGSVKKRV
jgi:hypothetical protein